MPRPTVETLHTPRLTLRPFAPDDRAAMLTLQGDPQVMRLYGNGEALSAAQVDIVLDCHVHCRERSYWAWAVTLRDDPAPPPPASACFGQITARPVEWAGDEWIELCWLLMPGRWRRGYATEGVREVIRHGTTDLGWRRMMANADLRNLPSLRVMTKNGLTLTREEHDAHGHTRQTYTLVKEPTTPMTIPGGLSESGATVVIPP